MCACDETFANRFLPHQLKEGAWLKTQVRVPVTLGFISKICPECRGNPPVPAPKAPMHGVTSKIKRYYWREFYFESTKRFYDKHPELDPLKYDGGEDHYADELEEIEKDVIEELKQLHERAPKYEYIEVSQKDVLSSTNTETILVSAEHVKTDKKVLIRSKNDLITAELFAKRYFEDQGYQVIESQSAPFHVLFGIFMWLLIEHSDDSRCRLVFFGSRTDFDNKTKEKGKLGVFLPEDFGTEGFYGRRKTQISRHLQEINDIDWLFDYWLKPSENFREYLWAHRKEDITKAREIVKVLGLENLKKVLEYLVMDYWRNFCGWPDLLIHKISEFMFVEVKSSNDSLSEDQKRWFLNNKNFLGFKAKVFKIGKK